MPERLNSLMVERRNYISEARVRSAVHLFIFFVKFTCAIMKIIFTKGAKSYGVCCSSNVRI